MTAATEHFAFDPSNTSITFRDDLRITRGDDRGRPFIVVEDPIAMQFFRLGKEEFAFARLLDGTRTVTEALREHGRRHPESTFAEDDAIELSRWLLANDLAHHEATTSANDFSRQADQELLSAWRQLNKAVCVRIPLARPDEWIGRCGAVASWLFGVPASLLGVLLIGYAGLSALGHAGELIQATRQCFGPQTLIVVMLCAVVLKLLHECGHAIVCKRYGGEIGDVGVFVILCVPLAYVNVNSAWRMESRLRRAHIAAAGMYVELLVAALAMSLWQVTDSADVKYVCLQLMLTATLATVICNGNPLMKFDGYFILTDLAAMPNLYSDAQHHWKRLANRIFFGERLRCPDWTSGYRTFVTVYGLLALLWKGFVCVTLIVGAAGLFGGLGVVLSIIAAGTWLGLPLMGLAARVRRASWRQRRRFALRAGLCLGGTAAVLLVLPAPGSGTAAGVVSYSPHEVIRAEVAGFVDKIHVTPGQRVDRGDVLLTLENRRLLNQAKQIALRVRSCELRIRQYTASGDHVAAQTETSRLRAIRNEHRERLQQIEGLRVRAPHAGQVVGRDLDQLIGTYLRPGDEILVIGNEDRKELRLLIDERDFETFRHRLGGTIEYRAAPSDVFCGTLVKINPQAKRAVEHQALAANHGGPLATTTDREVDDQPQETRWVTPHFEAVVAVERSDSRTLQTGQRIIARLPGGQVSVGVDLTRQLKNLLARPW